MKRGTRLALAGALLGGLLAPGVGRAQQPFCQLSGPNGTYKVGKISLPGGSSTVGMGWVQNDPAQFPFTDDRGYFTVLGFFIVDAATHRAVRWVVHAGGAAAPHTVVRVNGTTYYDAPFPSTRLTGGHGGIRGLVGGALDPGTYYVVGFGWGASEGLLGEGRWSVAVYTGVDCPLVNAPGELVSYNHADFQGPTHIYAPLVGVGSGLGLNFQAPRNTVLGSVYAAITDTYTGRPVGWVGGRVDMRYTTPTYSDRVGTTTTKTSIKQLASIGGPYTFAADYYGIDPLLNITFLQVDLP